tara:strand:- start:56 stop:481 length:426 start_codon:yes stop_codon:yes gene_type:complete
MSKRFENKEDLKREENAIKLFTSKHNFNYKKLGDYDLDFLITNQDGSIVGSAEVKGRKMFLQNQSELPLAERKYNKIMECKKAKIIIWAYKDGIVYCQLNRLKGIKRKGGRKPREGAANDVEMMHYYNRKENDKVLSELKY